MTAPMRAGADLICDGLKNAGVSCVFGLPGTQNVALFEALRASGLRTVVATNELSAAMMANGYYRASGRLAALATIPGPGFTWALTGLAEAALDSAALVHVVGQPAATPGAEFQLQAIDQSAMAAPVVRAEYRVDDAGQALSAIADACARSVAGEPGPVLVHVAASALESQARTGVRPVVVAPMKLTGDIAGAAEALATARRCVIIAGQGCHGAAGLLMQLADTLSAVVVTTTSGRGVVAEDHRLSLGFELGGNGAGVLNDLVAASDIVLAIGCKFSHNGSRGFRLRLPVEKLIHVDASAAVLGANYPARWPIVADAGAALASLLASLDGRTRPTPGFSDVEIAGYRARGRAEGGNDIVEPRIHGTATSTPAEFFAALRAAMPRVSCLVTDSGLHQVLTRRFFRVLHPRGLITPTNLQSMGFGIGAATGACLADPARPVVALIGDGGLAMSGLELLTAVRERLHLTVIVFVDGAFGLIRVQQLAATGRSHGTEFAGMDCEAFAAAIGARHVRLKDHAEATLAAAIGSDGVTLVEVAVGDSLPMHWLRAKGLVRGTSVGRRAKSWLRRLLRRG